MEGPSSARLFACRADTMRLIGDLSDADATVQSMDDASPAKWHAAHTTWFFEEFILLPFVPGYEAYDSHYRFLFNSYYEMLGARHPRPRRGLLSRPSLDEIKNYRRHVDAALARALEKGFCAQAEDLLDLGIAHEQQHQELILTDILHLFAQNPLRPAFRHLLVAQAEATPLEGVPWVSYPGGIFLVGQSGDHFGFDCERPRHRVLVAPFALAARPVTNRQWCEFVADGAYRRATLWLSDGWKEVQSQDWQAPLYWERRDDAFWEMTLCGPRPIELDAPVSHISYYEADAYARWAGERLPTEFEWEIGATRQPIEGNFADSGRYRPMAGSESAQSPLRQLYGDVWEWTASPYTAYPGFRAAPGAVGEYNGKFMSGQFVLRGGSCATPKGHVRPSYRNFFYPHQRWQFTGLRLAQDGA